MERSKKMIKTLEIKDPALFPIAEKIEKGERLTLEDGLLLYKSPDLLSIGQMADAVNRRFNGDDVYFIENMYINPTNICEANCAFCGFKRKRGEDGAYTMNDTY